MQELLFLPVPGIRYDDLFDWSDSTQKCKKTTTILNTKGLNSDLETVKIGKLVKCNEVKIAIFRHGPTVYAMKDKCPHAGGPLHLGDIEELADGKLCVRCPWHGWRFHLDTGDVTFPKGHSKSAITYPVLLKDGNISIGFESLSEIYFNDDQEF